jgi:hypothetical protein
MRAALLALALALLVLPGCKGKGESTFRRVLEGAAHVVPDSADARVAHQDALNARCRETATDFPSWRACMEPAYKVDAAVAVFSSWLLATEASIDATGADGWRAIAPCVLGAARHLAAAFTAAGLRVPEQVTAILALGGSIAGECGE